MKSVALLGCPRCLDNIIMYLFLNKKSYIISIASVGNPELDNYNFNKPVQYYIDFLMMRQQNKLKTQKAHAQRIDRANRENILEFFLSDKYGWKQY